MAKSLTEFAQVYKVLILGLQKLLRKRKRRFLCSTIFVSGIAFYCKVTLREGEAAIANITSRRKLPIIVGERVSAKSEHYYMVFNYEKG